MKGDSMRLVLAGGMIGLLVLSAAAWKAVRGPVAPAARSTDPAAMMAASAGMEADRTAAQTQAVFGEDAAPVFAEPGGAARDGSAQEREAGPFTVALRVREAVWGEKLFVCDEVGCPLEEIMPDRDGDQTLGPLAPGRYGVFRGGTEIGSFRLRGNASLDEAGGRLWTDGELLYVERWVSGTARLDLRLPSPGYYSLKLCDRVGQEWDRDLYIPDRERPDSGQAYARTVEFRGLPEGLYTLVYRGAPLGQLEVRAGETTEFVWTIDN